MSLESDLEAFKFLALEEQIKIPYYIEKYGSTQPVYDNLDPVLSDIVGGCRVAITGEIYVPEVNEFGHNIGHILLNKEVQPLIGINNGVNVCDRGYLCGSEDDRYLVGYSAGLDRGVRRQNALEITESRFFAFAPVETSTLHVPDLALPQEILLPKGNDHFADSIDVALLDETKDFDSLIAIFNELLKQQDLVQDYYLNYLNRVFPLKDYQLTVITKSCVQETSNDTYYESFDLETSHELVISPSHFENTADLDGLCIVFFWKDIDDELEKYLIPLSEVSKMSFKLR